MHFTGRDRLIADRLQREIIERLEFLNAVGLGYLSLDRSAATLSGGEGQRIRLATQIGSRLRGVLYVLDEPSIGLHQRDNQRLIHALEDLRDLGNTVLVVEHDEDTIRKADYVLDLGPGAGKNGGNLIAAGTPAEIMANPASVTGQYLAGKIDIVTRPNPDKKPRELTGRWLSIEDACSHNLQHVDAHFPLGVMTVVTGVSGSGKSTLVNDILYRALAKELYGSREEPGAHKAIHGADQFDKVIQIDQSPIGRTPRSNPATYTGVFTAIRDLFAMLPESRERGYKPGRFSFNVTGRPLRGLPGRRPAPHRDELPARRLRPLRSLQRPPLQPGNALRKVQRLLHRRHPRPPHRRRRAHPQGHPRRPPASLTRSSTSASATSTSASPPPPSPAAKPSA